MSDTPTPRTDAEMWSENGIPNGCCTTAAFARTLERELSTALATIAERDRRIAELEKAQLVSESIRRWSHTCIHHTDAERATDVECPICLARQRDTATRELAEAKADIARLAEEYGKADADRVRLGAQLIGQCLKGGDPECPTEKIDRACPAAHDTSNPSVQRPVCQHCGEPEKCHWSHALYCPNPCDSETTQFTPVTHAPMAYETFVLMKEAVEAQCKATADVTADRDRLKEELAKETQQLDLVGAALPNEFEGSDDNFGTMVRIVVEERNELTAERDQLKAENDKLRATVAAKDEAIELALKYVYRELGDRFESSIVMTVEDALSPEIANEFVRREVLEECHVALDQWWKGNEHGDADEMLSAAAHFDEAIKLTPAALSRAETELAKGNHP